MKRFICLFFLFTLISFSDVFSGNNKVKINKNSHYVAEIKTSQGNIKFVFLNSTPDHLTNFVNNVDEKVYNGMKFHRIVRKFVIQAGDLKTKNENYPRSEWGKGGKSERVFPEFVDNAIHTIGAVGMAREGNKTNPDKLSSGSHFYIVQGRNSVTKDMLDSAEERRGVKYDSQQRQSYLRDGGQPKLDGEYVVFGYVIEGMNIVDEIANMPKNERDVPFQNIVINKIDIKKISNKKLEKKYSYYAK